MADWIPLTTADCASLLRAGVLGRVAVVAGGRPHIVPMNYSVVGEAVVLRTAVDSLLAHVPEATPMAFEVDAIDVDGHRGWSVVAHGPTRHVTDVEEVDRLVRYDGPRPWASGARPHVVRLPWTELTGVRLGGTWDLRAAMPVRRSL